MTITVLIPAWNAGPFLRQALESVAAQTRRPDEILVIDDCSTDGSDRIALSFSGVRLLRTPSNSGHAAARNLGVAQAGGDVIAWLDADDYWEPQHCEIVCGLLEQFPEAPVAYSAVRRFGSEDSIWYDAPQDERPFPALWHCFARTIVPAMSAITRTDVVRAVGGFDTSIRIAPDFDFWIRMAKRGPFVSTRTVTSNYRLHRRQISAVDPTRQFASVYQARYRHLAAAIAADDSPLVRALDERVRSLWARDLIQLWRRGPHALLPVFLGFANWAGGETPLSRRIRRALRYESVAGPLLGAARRLPGLRDGARALYYSWSDRLNPLKDLQVDEPLDRTGWSVIIDPSINSIATAGKSLSTPPANR